MNNNPNEMEEFYHFDINLEDEVMQRNILSEEFLYGLNEEVEKEEDLAEFAIEDVGSSLILNIKNFFRNFNRSQFV